MRGAGDGPRRRSWVWLSLSPWSLRGALQASLGGGRCGLGGRQGWRTLSTWGRMEPWQPGPRGTQAGASGCRGVWSAGCAGGPVSLPASAGRGPHGRLSLCTQSPLPGRGPWCPACPSDVASGPPGHWEPAERAWLHWGDRGGEGPLERPRAHGALVLLSSLCLEEPEWQGRGLVWLPARSRAGTCLPVPLPAPARASRRLGARSTVELQVSSPRQAEPRIS